MLRRARRIAPLFGNLSWFGAGCAILLSLIGAQTANAASATLSVDAAKTSGPLKTFVNFAQGRRGTFDRFTTGEQTRLTAVGTRLVRIDAMLHIISTAEGVYDWTLLDGNIENVQATGADVLLTLGYMPTWLADTSYGTDPYVTGYGYAQNPPTDFAKWQQLVRDVVFHLNITKGYGIKYFAVWNEPNLTLVSSTGMSGYYPLYKYAAQGVKAADPTAKVGGPTVAGFDTAGLQGLINYVKANSLPLNFVNWHGYEDTLPSKLPGRAATVRSWLTAAGLPTAELIMTEWNADQGPPVIEDDPLVITRSAGMVAPMNWYALDAGLSEIFYFRVKRPAPTLQGIIQDGGTPPFPQYNSFTMLSMMAGTRISASEAMDANGIGVGALAAKDPDVVTVLTWNYQNTGTTSFSTDLVVSSLPSEFSGKSIRMKRYLVDETHSNVTYDPTKAELEKVEDLVLPPAAGVSRTFTLQPNAVSLIVLSPEGGSSAADTTAPSAPTNLRNPSVSSSAAYLMWSASSDNVKVVGYKVYRQGVQVATTASTSYSDPGLTASTTYSYTVRAYDAAGNTSAPSNAVSVTTQALDAAPAPPKGLQVF